MKSAAPANSYNDLNTVTIETWDKTNSDWQENFYFSDVEPGTSFFIGSTAIDLTANAAQVSGTA